jgi:molybdate-binding protein
MVNRNKGSGTRVLIDHLLDGARPRGYVEPSWPQRSSRRRACVRLLAGV